jgi:hypothetical protein
MPRWAQYCISISLAMPARASQTREEHRRALCFIDLLGQAKGIAAGPLRTKLGDFAMFVAMRRVSSFQ